MGMSGGDAVDAVTIADMARAAVAGLLPQASSVMPPEAGTMSAIGVAPEYARADHTHEVRARRKRITLAAGTGTYAGKFVATYTFDKPFKTKPMIGCFPEDDGGQPLTAAPITASFTQDINGLWTSVVVRGWRSQAIPQNLATLLLGGVFNLFGASAAGAVIGVQAAEETPTAA